jgi:hypothetical protein
MGCIETRIGVLYSAILRDTPVSSLLTSANAMESDNPQAFPRVRASFKSGTSTLYDDSSSIIDEQLPPSNARTHATTASSAGNSFEPTRSTLVAIHSSVSSYLI